MKLRSYPSTPLATKNERSFFNFALFTKLFTFIFFISFCIQGFAQPTWTSTRNGAWSSSSTWNRSGGATGAPPTQLLSNQRVIITGGDEVTLGSGSSSIIMDGTSTL